MAELKPCPFCGGGVRYDKAYSYFRDSVIYCDDCDMVFTLDDCQASDDEICETWNRRADNNHAHWIGTEIEGYTGSQPVYSTVACSHCGFENDQEPAYCEQCGYRMDEVIS